MADINYGVVEQDGSWIIIGANLRYGSYPTREEAEDAARRLAERSAGPVKLHVQDETGELKATECIP